MAHKDPGRIPSRWINCPPIINKLIVEKFIAFKTPLGSQFDKSIPQSKHFTPSMVFAEVKRLKASLGLWIDLTYTSRFYDKKEVEKMKCKYVKLQCRGHGETPSKDQTNVKYLGLYSQHLFYLNGESLDANCVRNFIKIVSDFAESHPEKLIGVHCTHGFNRTGFMIVSYLIEQFDTSLEAAIKEFAQFRVPGIYKQDYLDELYKRYNCDPEDPAPIAPPRPDWCEDEEFEGHDDNMDAGNSASSSKGRKRSQRRVLNKTFQPEVSGVDLVTDPDLLKQLRLKVNQYCKWNHNSFPGAQPVTMTLDNVNLLAEKPYMVSWKADGVRYMMLIDGEDRVFMFDRDNCVFHAKNLRFFHNTLGRPLEGTLVDGEMVIDNEAGVKRIRYLCYDVIKFENQNVARERFDPIRRMCIEKEIINPRNRAIQNGTINKDAEPFRVVLKQFWDISRTHTLLEEKFARTLSHEPDGLIFQPSCEPYIAGTCKNVLKWKPPELNSVDFRLQIETENRMGMLQVKQGKLYVGSQDMPFSSIKLTSALKQYNNKIIECKVQDNSWVFMRERTDKSFPNHYSTAISVLESILKPVTQDYLLNYIAEISLRRHNSAT